MIFIIEFIFRRINQGIEVPTLDQPFASWRRTEHDLGL
jgi:hypothetical protein